MATYRKRKAGWYAEVRMKGAYHGKTFPTKTEARAWATEIEAGLKDRRHGAAHLLSDAFDRYGREISPGKKGAQWELVRLRLLSRHQIAQVSFARLSAQDVATWRDNRLQDVSPSTVNRELNLISSVVEVARKEWGWAAVNPVRDIQRPKKPRPRDRRISQDEIDRVLMALNYDEAGEIHTRQQEIGLLFLLALETAMRLGEMCGLEWHHVFLKNKHLKIVDSKNADQRDVPLTSRAIELLQKVEKPEGPVFSVSSGVASTLFRRAVNNAGIQGLRFHDSRHEALTRLARKLDVLDLARMVGHRDPRSLMIYYNATAEEIANRLD